MKNSNRLKILFIFFASLILLSCAKKDNNIDFDFSTLKKTKDISVKDTGNKNKTKPNNKLLIEDLVPLKNREQILSKTNIGKRDPFSKDEFQANKLNSNFKLTGFLNTEKKKYAFVSFLDNKGTITEGSVGGLNTNLLPNGAKVINLDSKNMQLTIDFDNETYIFGLQD